MTLRNVVIAALLLVLVGGVWWVLRDFAGQTDRAPYTSPTAEAPAVLTQDDTDEFEYPDDYVDDLPLDDAPPLPAAVLEGYVPVFERPDLIGDGMLVPLEFEIDAPELDLDGAEAP